MAMQERSAEETAEEMRSSVAAALPPGARIHVTGDGSHFSLRVESAAFAGKGALERQRLVLRAISHLMKGDGAPVHAIDRLTTVVPEE